MSKTCQITGKRPRPGNQYALRGIAKKKKGIGLKITGIKKRRFQPNLVKKRFYIPEENRFVTLRVSTQGMRIIDKLGISPAIRKAKSEKLKAKI
ncbi:MAG: 50S ribosomal protein L28 [Chlamydiae bacterium]|nr:50S ribosomal protein L28 [Chlamydiota bacterium]